MRIQMFVENPAGSVTKHLHDEDTLVLVGLLEQFEETGDQCLVEDHNLLTCRVGDTRPATVDEIETLKEFITSVFGDTGPVMHVGAVRDARDAAQLLSDRLDCGAVM
ncbi:hypothetical protein [Candidatus Poriferisodalis sp.]|uniref:hypothetical protein n=1 Tax=Candidatus Poriferisodalis sp. TaxID=3101277 RepID=UPI003C704521